MSTEKRIEVLEAECARMHAQLLAAQGAMEAMRASMGEEWQPIGYGWNPANPDVLHCVECLNRKAMGHQSICHRGRFFALTPASGAEWAEAIRLYEIAIEKYADHENWMNRYPMRRKDVWGPKQNGWETAELALAALRRARGGGE